MVKYNRKYCKEVLDCQCIQLTATIQVRTLLSINLKNDSNKVATFIMMNPSLANHNISDKTVNKVIKFAFIKGKGKIGIVNMVNLFPFYETNSSNLQTIINRVKNNVTLNFDGIISNNNNIIFKNIKLSKWVILAWGNPSVNIDSLIHDKQCSSILNYISSVRSTISYVIKTQYYNILTKDGYPRHPSRPSLKGFKKCLINEEGKIII